ncbi:MAG: hypothetical protein KF835_12270 [Xanthobacteraceae bacterium]|nr:hypothetical protein [Xanthobacteraceae bacterium]
MTQEALQSLYALAFGFCFAGLLCSGYQVFAERPASFRLLNATRLRALSAIPFLMFAAPFIILRNTVRGRLHEDRNIGFVALATIIAGLWSLFAGTAAVEALRFAAGLS